MYLALSYTVSDDYLERRPESDPGDADHQLDGDQLGDCQRTREPGQRHGQHGCRGDEVGGNQQRAATRPDRPD